MNMKRFLLSILCCLLACVSIHAEEVTFDFKELYGNATLGSITSKTVDDITISYDKNGASSVPAFNKDGTLRLYYGAGGTGCSATFTTDGTKKITGAVITAYSTSYTPTVKYSVDGGNLTSGTWSSTTMTISGIEASETLMIQNAHTTNTQLRIKSIVLTVEEVQSGGGDSDDPETPVAPTAPTLPASCSFDDAMTVTITNISEGATVYYTTDGTTDPSTSNGTKYSAPFEITATTTVKAIAVNEAGSSDVVSATYTKNEVQQGVVIDVLNRELTSVSSGSTSYTSWQGKTSKSTAVYAGQSAGSNDAIQLRATNPSGIITTKSGGKAKKITVVWQQNTTTSRTLDIYGKNSAYSESADLYDNSKRGTKLGSIVKGTSTELIITDDYEFIGLRSNSNAMYITSIEITWDNSENANQPTVDAPLITADVEEFNAGDNVEVTITTTTDGATIYYTVDGSYPSSENGTIYEGPFFISSTTTLQAIAVKADCIDSHVATKKFTKVIALNNSTVAEAIAAYTAGDRITSATIVGYIVGSNSRIENLESDTNLLIADNPEEDNVNNCMLVQLPSGLIRDTLNLKENPDNYKKKIAISGSVEKYYDMPGLKEPTSFEFIVEQPDDDEPTSETWGSLFSPYDVEIPENVKVYIVTGENNGYVKLEKITGAVPAMAGVIYNGEWNNKETATSEVADVTGNLLEGSVYDEYVEEEAFVLAKVDGVVGFYKALMNQKEGTAFKNNGGKAYLPVSALTSSAQNAASLKFRFDNQTTGIESAPALNTAKAIYDLSGRKVNNATAPGLYIINGKKVMVK